MLKHNETSINFGAKSVICSSGSLHKWLKSKQQLRLLEASAPRPSQALPLGWNQDLLVTAWQQGRACGSAGVATRRKRRVPSKVLFLLWICWSFPVILSTWHTDAVTRSVTGGQQGQRNNFGRNCIAFSRDWWLLERVGAQQLHSWQLLPGLRGPSVHRLGICPGGPGAEWFPVLRSLSVCFVSWAGFWALACKVMYCRLSF